MMRRIGYVAAMALCAVNVWAGEPQAPAMAPTVMALSVTEAFREAMAENPKEGGRLFFSAPARVVWDKRCSEAELAEVPLADFFTGAVSMAGALSEKGAITALYNPWQDAILLLRWGPSVRYGQERVPQAEETAFLCGETFRGEAKTPLRVDTVVPPKSRPLATVLWEKTAATAARFDVLYPLTGEAHLHTTAWDIAPAVARTALRMKWLVRLGEGKGGELARVQLIGRELRFGEAERLARLFPNPNTAFYCKTWAAVPAKVRQSLVPYGWYAVQGAKGRELMLAYVSSVSPTVVTLVSLRPEQPATLEWFDLKQSAELLAVWQHNNK